MIKILYALNGIFHKGGTEAVVLNYYNNLNKDVFQVDFLLHGEKPEKETNATHLFLLKNGSNIYYVAPRGNGGFLKNKQQLKEFFKNNKFDVVHSHMDAAGCFVLSAARKAGIPIRVAHSHNTNHQINKGNKLINIVYKVILNHSKKSLIKQATSLVACSKDAGIWLFGSHDFSVLNNAIEVDKYIYKEPSGALYKKEYNVKENFVIGHIGRFSYQKNHEFLIDVFQKVYEQNNNCVLVLVGDGELKENIEKKVKKLGLMNSVIFLGNRSDISELINMFDLFVLPSRFEGLPVVLVETQSNGLLNLISDTIAKEVEFTETIEFLPEGEKESWINRILQISKNVLPRKNTVNDVINAGYDIGSVVDKLEKIYINKQSFR